MPSTGSMANFDCNLELVDQSACKTIQCYKSNWWINLLVELVDQTTGGTGGSICLQIHFMMFIKFNYKPLGKLSDRLQYYKWLTSLINWSTEWFLLRITWSIQNRKVLWLFRLCFSQIISRKSVGYSHDGRFADLLSVLLF